MELVPGPDFPTGGVLVEDRDSVAEAYATGRGSFRLRAKWEVRNSAMASTRWSSPKFHQVQKGRIVEKIADLLNAKKLALLGDIRDESAEDIRLILEPRNRSIEPAVLMEQMFRMTDRNRANLNMNVLDSNTVPRVMNLRDVLRSFLEHRETLLLRRTKHRLAKIKHRLEVLEGYLVAYLNLDEVIRIIREEDEPKAIMMKKWKLTDVQAEAILNMRLRALRRLEENAIKEEHAVLLAEKKTLNALLKNRKKREAVISGQIKDIRTKFGKNTDLGARRTEIGVAPEEIVVPLDILIEREPITVICSQKGWIRGAKGHLTETADLKYKEGDRGRYVLHAQTTDKILIFATNGRFYTLSGDKLPGGRGHGDPVRLMVDLPNDQDIVAYSSIGPARKLSWRRTDVDSSVRGQRDCADKERQAGSMSARATRRSLCTRHRRHDGVIGDNRKIILLWTNCRR